MLGFLLYIKYGIFSSVPLELFVEHTSSKFGRSVEGKNYRSIV